MNKNEFKGGNCPISGLPTPNVVLASQSEKDCHVSYNSSSSDYGTDTTAIVLHHNVFLVLNGDHRKELKERISESKIKGCVDYYIENIEKSNKITDHHFITGSKQDIFNTKRTITDLLGEGYIEKFKNAANRYEDDKRKASLGKNKKIKGI